ncbi:MAG: tRNA pseudouridine(38-40) synthase TruA [Nitratireductor sp.]|nr:tRNA pseudouridine(38-40) synthase TruA [Nitratireductor sp.]
MPRYKLTIEYYGTPFHGWQRQEDFLSVQQVLEEAISEFTRHPVTVFAAGRTDTGVHGLGQIVHLDLERQWAPEKVSEAANGVLKYHGHPVAVLDCEQVADDFDARFSAKRRHYRYRILNRWANLTVELGRAWHVKKPLDVAAMDSAAKMLIGHHDFTTFRAMNCQAKSPMRTLDTLDVRHVCDLTGGGQEIEITTSSRAFLHNQVRSMAGSLKLVGEGKWTADDLAAALAAKDRKACGPVAPACGLYFVRVDY